jgi:pilus assembly protein CpaC
MANIRLIGQHRQVTPAGRAPRLAAKFVWSACIPILVLALADGGAVVWAQARPLAASAVVAASPEIDGGSVRLLVGRSTVLDVNAPISRVSLTSADVADALVTSPNQLLINGKMPGTISMFVWDRAGSLRRYEVVVQRDLALLAEQMKELFPGEQIEVQSNGKNVVLTGKVTSKDVIEKAINVAAGYVDKREEVTALLQLQAGAPSNQVLLRVRFAEVSRTALTELGASFGANGYKDGRWYGRTTTQQFAAPQWDEQGRFVFSDFLNLFLFDTENQLAGVIKALQNRGLFESLAEPNLVAESGKEASFLAGGEIPIPIAQGTGGNVAISVTFKEFGIRLNFTPTVTGNRVHLKVAPEVSSLDFSNAVVLQGFRIPALTTRKTETELELENGQTFAIAGLMNNTVRNSMSRIPGIGHIPIIGLLFSSKAAQKENTELVVMITPEILPNNSRGVTPDLPRLPERFMDPLPNNRTTPMPPSPYPSARPGASANPAGQPVAVAPGTTGADAAVQAVTPSVPQVAAPATGAPAAVARPLTPQEQRQAEEQARREGEALARAQAAERRRQTEAAVVARRAAEKERQEKEKLAREQAKRDAEAAKRAQEAARRQAEVEREQQKRIAEAEAKLKAAEASYQAEVAKKNQP